VRIPLKRNMSLDIGKLFNKWRERNIISGVENKIEIESRATVSFNNNLVTVPKNLYEINAHLTIFYPLGTTGTL
jgi:hypothetical protein